MEAVVDGIKTSYIDVGSGEAVLMLHGWGSKKELFDNIIQPVSEKYRVIAPDFPGFGSTDEPGEVWCVDDFVRWTVKFVSSLELKKIILLGHSFGGRVVIKMASREDLPFEIDKIILTGSAGIMPKRSLSYKIKVGSYKLGKKFLMLPPVKALFPDALENMQKKRGSADYAAASHVMRGCLVRVVNEDLRDYLPGIKQSTLLIWGTEDDATPVSDGELMEKLIPDAGLVKLKGAGHYSWLNDPYTFIAVLKSFLNIG
ncbi:MAG: alpha/beta hydrolase [Clostridia bacterium]|nr:alpha/beta hydrolase [Clostridia bacterium]